MAAVTEKVGLTSEVKQSYANVIKILFDGVLSAEPDQINDQVVEHVDTMLREIAKCSEAIKKLAFETLYSVINLPLGGLTSSIIMNWYINNQANGKIEDIIEEWVIALTSDYKFRPCLEGARVNWKSTIEIDLLGI